MKFDREKAIDMRLDIVQIHEDGKVILSVLPTYSWSTEEPPELTAALIDPDERVTEFSQSPIPDITIENPRLWQPRGYGGQPLYTVRVQAWVKGELIDSWEHRIGLRTVKLSIEPDEHGESFAHEINGVRIFAMGAHAVPGPEDNIRQLLEDAALANFNCIRALEVFPDPFYDICDELGLMVWQDFSLPCTGDELTTEAARNIRDYVCETVTRLRSHPCIVLWCGSECLEQNALMEPCTPRQKADYIRVFEYIIPTELRKHAPEAPYWPSSPSSGGGFDEPGSLDRGDAHPRCSDRSAPGRYVSDFGTPSCPCLPTVESFTRPQERNLFSRAVEEHSEDCRHTAHIMSNISRYYLYPASFPTLIYASQLAQAQIVSSAAGHYRRHRGRCMGALFRRLSDPRPEISPSSIDFSGRWKALHYFARRFFAPLLLSCEGPLGRSFCLCVTNDTLTPRAVLVKWALRDNFCRVIREETISLTVPPLESAWLDRTELPEVDIHSDFLSFALYEKSALLSFGTALFAPPKHYNFQDPGLEFVLDGDEIIVASKAYAQGVEISNANEDLVLSDNYFDMLPGKRRIKILRGEPDNIKLRSVYDIK